LASFNGQKKRASVIHFAPSQSKRLNSGGNARATGAITGGGLVNPDNKKEGARIDVTADTAENGDDEDKG
jgi:hypothetical protein